MALPNLKDQNIQDTYQRVVQTDGTKVYDGTGSLLPIEFNENHVIISGTLTAQSYIVSESVTSVSSGSTIFGNSGDDIHQFSGSLKVSGSIESINDSIVDRVGGGPAGFYINNNLWLGYPSSDSHVRVGNPSYAVTMSAFAVNIDSGLGITLDSNMGYVDFADSGDVSVQINTSNGNISASGTITGTIKGGKF